MLNIGIIGYGYWGPNIARNFSSLGQNVDIKMICDLNAESLQRASTLYKNCKLTTDYNELINSSDIDAIAIVTPVSSHCHLAKKALENGKHIFVEKPFTASVAEAETLVELAERKGLVIMVDHTFLFTSAVMKIKELVDDGTLGRLHYYDSMRVNLGLFQTDVNVVWDLAPHDFSIMQHLVKDRPVAISAHGQDHYKSGLANTAFIVVHFDSDFIAHFNVNWLSPVKLRQTLISGDNKMLYWDDIEPDNKIKVYDKGVNVDSKESMYEMIVGYRSGDMYAPKLDQSEALREEASYFVKAINEGFTPFNDGKAGLEVVRLLEAAEKSIKSQGKTILL